jgi:hypothetical protein
MPLLTSCTWGNMKRKIKKARLGSGERFEAVAEAARKSGAKDPEAVAAAVGRKTLGKAKFQKLAAKGLRRYWRKKKGA